MRRHLLVVDGTNVGWAWERSRLLLLRGDYGSAQRMLVESAVAAGLASLHQELIFVFDGGPAVGGPGSGQGARVLHPDIGRTADDRIVELIGQRGHAGAPIELATSDRALRDMARSLGATTIGAQEFISRLEPTRPEPGARPAPVSREKPSPSRRDTEDWLQRFGSVPKVRRNSPRAPQKEGDSR